MSLEGIEVPMKQTGPNFAEQRLVQRKKTAWVWRLLEETGIKRRFLARHLGVSYGYLNQVQYGQAPISRPMRQRISEFLGVDEAKLFEDLDQYMNKED
jgi:transcriptional regulator with XRE-family HTH domain